MAVQVADNEFLIGARHEALILSCLDDVKLFLNSISKMVLDMK
jgi:hypothetical protein